MNQRYSLSNSVLRDRSTLFGNAGSDHYFTSSSSPLSSRLVSSHVSPYAYTPYRGANGNHSSFKEYGHDDARQRTAEELESQNDEHLEGLTAKVKLLKDITIGIGNEIKESTIQLSQMNDAFSETSGVLSGTFRRLNNMAGRQGCRWLWYIAFLICVFWFFIVVWWLRR